MPGRWPPGTSWWGPGANFSCPTPGDIALAKVRGPGAFFWGEFLLGPGLFNFYDSVLREQVGMGGMYYISMWQPARAGGLCGQCSMRAECATAPRLCRHLFAGPKQA